MFRSISIAVVVLLYAQIGHGQYYQEPEQQETVSTIYLGLSTGIDNYVGLFGVGADIGINPMWAVRVGAGLGSWGTKLAGGIRYENRTSSGWGFGLSYSHCPGVEDIELQFQDRTITMDLLPTGSVNLTATRSWVMKRNHRFYIDLGYAVATGGSNIYRVNDPSITLNDEEETVLEIVRPGGIILALGFMFALN